MNTLTLVLMTLSMHSTDNHQFNNQNWGVGVEVTHQLTFGVYAYHNSYESVSLMLSVSKHWQNWGLGVAAANGYELDQASVHGVLAAPEMTYQFNPYLRVKTSAPFGQLIGQKDVVNVQLTYPF